MKINGVCRYVYRAIDQHGHVIDAAEQDAACGVRYSECVVDAGLQAADGPDVSRADPAGLSGCRWLPCHRREGCAAVHAWAVMFG